MTEKLYWQDAYLKEFEAKVEEVMDGFLVLDKTAFYPRGGGLVSDLGEIDGVKVTEVKKEGDDRIFHKVEDSSKFSTGGRITGKLDWDRRHRVMRMHTAAHLLSAIINKETGALITGNSIEPDESRVDFSLESFDKGKIEEYLQKANEHVKQSLEVKTYFLNREEAMKLPGIVKLAQAMPPEVEQLRIVDIMGVDIQADGGVHVKNVSEVGTIRLIKTENKGKNNRRLYFTVE